MKRLLLILALLINYSVQAQQLDGHDLNEIIELYFDGQNDIIKAKLANAGFIVTKSTPDYTLHGIAHSGDFVMTCEQPSKDPEKKALGWPDVSRFFFETIDYGISRKEFSISFDLENDYSSNAFDYLAFTWSRNATYKDTCTEYTKCLQLIYHFPDKPIGKMSVYDYHISLSNTPLREGPARDNFHGMLALRIVPLEAIKKVSAPAKSKGK